MPRKSRKSISLKGLTYHRLKNWCERNGVSVGGTIEEWAYERLRSNRPKVPYHLYEVVEQTDERRTHYALAPSPEIAEQWVSTAAGVFPTNIQARLSSTIVNTDKISFALVGVLSDADLAELTA